MRENLTVDHCIQHFPSVFRGRVAGRRKIIIIILLLNITRDVFNPAEAILPPSPPKTKRMKKTVVSYLKIKKTKHTVNTCHVYKYRYIYNNTVFISSASYASDRGRRGDGRRWSWWCKKLRHCIQLSSLYRETNSVDDAGFKG